MNQAELDRIKLVTKPARMAMILPLFVENRLSSRDASIRVAEINRAPVIDIRPATSPAPVAGADEELDAVEDAGQAEVECAAKWQRGANPGQFLAPPTATRLRLRNAMFKTRTVQRLLVASTKSAANDAGLPDYEQAAVSV